MVRGPFPSYLENVPQLWIGYGGEMSGHHSGFHHALATITIIRRIVISSTER